MSVLADSSVWISHWRHPIPEFAALGTEEAVVTHPFVVGELALGTIEPRAETLRWFQALPLARVADHDEVIGLVERHRLWSSGIGWIDAHLIASALLDRLELWTLDLQLAQAAVRAGVRVVR